MLKLKSMSIFEHQQSNLHPRFPERFEIHMMHTFVEEYKPTQKRRHECFTDSEDLIHQTENRQEHSGIGYHSIYSVQFPAKLTEMGAGGGKNLSLSPPHEFKVLMFGSATSKSWARARWSRKKTNQAEG